MLTRLPHELLTWQRGARGRNVRIERRRVGAGSFVTLVRGLGARAYFDSVPAAVAAVSTSATRKAISWIKHVELER